MRKVRLAAGQVIFLESLRPWRLRRSSATSTCLSESHPKLVWDVILGDVERRERGLGELG